jgi:hypothetical protein
MGIVVHICNPSTQEAKAGGAQVRDYPGVLIENLSQKNKIK